MGRTARAGRRGWSLSFVTQYDIDLVQQIEVLVGQQLGKFELEEAEALKGITKVGRAGRGRHVCKPGAFMWLQGRSRGEA